MNAEYRSEFEVFTHISDVSTLEINWGVGRNEKQTYMSHEKIFIQYLSNGIDATRQFYISLFNLLKDISIEAIQ